MTNANTNAQSFANYLATQADFNGTVYGFTKTFEVTPAEATQALIEAVASGDVDTAVETRGNKQVLTACLSKRAIRRINRANRKDQAAEVTQAIVNALEANRPLRIKAIVTAVQAEMPDVTRAQILDVLRAGRDAETPVFFSFNKTNSNFHMEWSTDSENVAFPEVPAPAAEAAAETEAVDTESDTDTAEGAEATDAA